MKTNSSIDANIEATPEVTSNDNNNNNIENDVNGYLLFITFFNINVNIIVQ